MQSAVKTNVAYDFSRFDTRVSVRDQINKDKAKAKSKQTAKVKPAVSAFAVFSFFACIGLVLLTLFSYVQLTELSDTAMSLQSELETLREENQMLSIENDQKFSAEKIKEEAVERLGMQKLDKSQITYLDMGSGNHVEIPQDTQVMRNSDFVAGIVSGFRWIVEYIN